MYSSEVAVTCGDQRFTYRELNKRVNGLAAGLSELGISRGQRVGVLNNNCHRNLEVDYAVTGIGAIVVPLNTRFKEKELTYIINNVGMDVLIVGAEQLEVMKSIRNSLPSVRHIISIDLHGEGYIKYEDLLSAGMDRELPGEDISEDDVAFIFYTSGTTGRPKGAMLTHRNVIANTINEALSRRFTDKDTYLHIVPQYHAGGKEFSFVTTYVSGRHVIPRSLEVDTILDAIEKERVTFLLLVPTIANRLISHPSFNRYNLSSLRAIVLGAGPSTKEGLKETKDKLGCDLYHGYGLTEAAPFVSTLNPEEAISKLGSCGREVYNVEVKIVAENGREVEPDTVGEIIVRGKNVMKGYWNSPDETAAALRGGWLYTGDLAKRDEEGYIYIVDRKKDMIISGGENIYPKEVEEVLFSHPAVLEAAVIGVPHEKWGETVKAIVVTKAGMNLTEDEVIEFCKKHLASYKKPTSVEFIDALPLNAAGKVIKLELKERFGKKGA